MTKLPKVSFTNQNEDFNQLHDYLDTFIPIFEDEVKNYLKPRGSSIGGKEIIHEDSTFTLHSPIDMSYLGFFSEANIEDVSIAVDEAKISQESWQNLGWSKRCYYIKKLVAEFEKDKYRLSVATLLEVGKCRLEAVGEAEECLDFANYYADEYRKNHGYEKTLQDVRQNEQSKSCMKPFGVFAVITPFNFPLAMSVNMILAAIITGNTVVWKPTLHNSLTSYMLQQIFDRALPKGVVNLILGGDDVGKELSENPSIDGVAFTGSSTVGRKLIDIMNNGGKYPRPALVEMGGKNPSYICETADLDVASLAVARSAFGMSSQKCSANTKIYVHENIYDEFIDKLVKNTQEIYVMGDVRDRNVTLGPVINEQSSMRYSASIDKIRNVYHGTTAIGGYTKREGVPAYAQSLYCMPTIIEGLESTNEFVNTELFVPITCVLKFSNLKDAILDDIKNNNNGLTSGIFTKEEDEIETFIRYQQTGTLYINRPSGSTTGTKPGQTSFVGWRNSGGPNKKGAMGPNYIQQFLKEQGVIRYF